MTNRYPGTCTVCGDRVAKGDGVAYRPAGARRFSVKHTSCADAQGVASEEDRFARSITAERGGVYGVYIPSSGFYGTRNAAGRCEDAPCCGCCTF